MIVGAALNEEYLKLQYLLRMLSGSDPEPGDDVKCAAKLADVCRSAMASIQRLFGAAAGVTESSQRFEALHAYLESKATRADAPATAAGDAALSANGTAGGTSVVGISNASCHGAASATKSAAAPPTIEQALLAAAGTSERKRSQETAGLEIYESIFLSDRLEKEAAQALALVPQLATVRFQAIPHSDLASAHQCIGCRTQLSSTSLSKVFLLHMSAPGPAH